MSLMTFLFPGAELARQKALAKINGMRRQMDESHEAEQPVRDLIADVLPLLRDAEMTGNVEAIEVPRDRIIAVAHAKALSDAIMDRPMWAGIDSGKPSRLFGYPVIEGKTLRIVSATTSEQLN